MLNAQKASAPESGRHQHRKGEVLGPSNVTGSPQMNNEENGLLSSPAARQRQITFEAMFRQEEIGASILVFDRFETGLYFRNLHSL
jgi:hypothetical protein